MQRGDSPDPARLVAAGYDRIADAYLAWSNDPALRLIQLERLTQRLEPQSRIVELGCGAGIPVARHLAALGHDITGFDISGAQIERARTNVPTARFVQADMRTLDHEADSLDAIVAFYAITHIPRVAHPEIFMRIATWLKPGGLSLASLGARDCPDWTGEWLGTQMFFSHFDAATNLRLVEQAGLAVLNHEVVVEQEDGQPVAFLWLLAQKPRRK